MTVEEILSYVDELSAADQDRVAAELAMRRWQLTLQRIATQGRDELPVADEELDALVHKARGETLRASGLRR